VALSAASPEAYCGIHPTEDGEHDSTAEFVNLEQGSRVRPPSCLKSSITEEEMEWGNWCDCHLNFVRECCSPEREIAVEYMTMRLRESW
jgi:hypothetical protein